MLHQLIGTLLESGTRADHILYASIEQPLLLNYSLAELVDLHLARLGKSNSTVYILLDEIQYQREWDIQLKALVDLRPSLRFIVTGSAGAALSSGSRESGAGRFSNFYLPALLFHEYLQLSTGWIAMRLNLNGKPTLRSSYKTRLSMLRCLARFVLVIRTSGTWQRQPY